MSETATGQSAGTTLQAPAPRGDSAVAPPTSPPATGATGPTTTTPPAREARPRQQGRADSNDLRTRSRSLFDRLAELDPHSQEHTAVRNLLVELNLPLVRYAAARFRSRNEPMEDIVQVGTIGLINAINRFDTTRGVQFPSFALPTIMGEIKRHFRDSVWSVHVPRRLHELWLQVNGAIEDLTAAHGRSPTVPEIAARLRVSPDEVVACMDAGRAHTATSLDERTDEEGSTPLRDRIGYEDPALTEVEHREMVRYLLVQLPERERKILSLRFFGNMTQTQISAELGISQMHVSRLIARSLDRLRDSEPEAG